MLFNQVVDGRKVRQFSLSTTFVEDFRGMQPAWGYNGLGFFTYKRTYARDLPEGGTEEFWQTCQRVVEGCFNIQKIHCNQMGLPWNEQKAQYSAQDMFQRMWDFKFSPPGRGLSVMGTDIVYQRGSASLQNCGFVSSENIGDDFADPFCFMMDVSMLGVGCGSDTKGAGKAKIILPKVTTEPHIVPDTRDGWVELIRTILNSFVGRGSFPQIIDYSQVRGRGASLKTFGGTASGPKPLHDLVVNIVKLLLPVGFDLSIEADGQDDWSTIGKTSLTWFGQDAPYRITSTKIVDLFNFIGKAVVAGGLRRTAEIMFGDPDDDAFMELKQDTEALNDRRWASNNSVFGYVGMDYTDLAQSMAGNGEPGIVWLDSAKKFGRMNDQPDNKDWRIVGTNPCGEMGLESRELCNLVETYPAHHDSYEDFERTLKMAYLYAKTVTLVPTHDMRANAVMMRNRRIGASMSGIVQAIQKFGRRKFLSWCDNGYKYIQKMDRTYSDWLGVPLSVKTTTVKPSGSVSLLCGATPGIHFPQSEFYIRHVRVQNQSPLCQIARDAGFQVFPDAYAENTSVVAFPVKEKHFIKGKSSVSLWEQFVLSADMQAHWSDNLVSATVTFSKTEIPDIKTCLEAFETRLKGVSLLPLLEEDHGYIYPPYQTITEQQYNDMVEGTKEMTFTTRVHDTDERFCSGDTCLLAMETSTQKT